MHVIKRQWDIKETYVFIMHMCVCNICEEGYMPRSHVTLRSAKNTIIVQMKRHMFLLCICVRATFMQIYVPRVMLQRGPQRMQSLHKCNFLRGRLDNNQKRHAYVCEVIKNKSSLSHSQLYVWLTTCINTVRGNPCTWLNDSETLKKHMFLLCICVRATVVGRDTCQGVMSRRGPPRIQSLYK